MYFIVLSVGAFTLLLSSFITIVILLRKQFKHWMNTSLYILSISDVLFSVFTSCILFINYMEQISYVDYNKWNNTFSLNNSMWNQDDNEKDQKDRLSRIDENFNSIMYQNNLNETPECNITNVIMKYGMLFIPFTNSFVSLLIFSVQCNLNVLGFKNQCFKFLQSQECITEKTYENDNSANKSKSQNVEKCETIEYEKIQINSKFKSMKHTNVSTIDQNKRKLLQAFKWEKMRKDNKKIISIFIIIQWITPIFVTGLLYLTDYDNKSYIKNIENTKCFIENNFLFDNCYSNIKYMDIAQNYSKIYAVPLYKDYIDNEDLVKSSNSNNTQVNEVVSKVQNIIYSVLNDTYNTSHNINHMNLYNTSILFDMMKYLQFDIHTRIIKHNNSIVNIKVDSTEDTLMMEHENPYNLTNTKNSTDLLNNIQVQNAINEYDKELLLFNYLMTNSSENILVNEDNSENEVITNSTEKLQLDKFHMDRFQATEAQIIPDELIRINQHNTSLISNDQIYAEILKRIHNITMQYKLKNYYKNNHQHNTKQLKHKGFQHNSTADKQNVLSVIKIIIYENNNTSNIPLIYVMHKCFISIQFLKLHLLVLIFVIYFLPILFSSILQQNGKLNCQIIVDRLKTKYKMLSTNFNAREISESKQDFIHIEENFEKSNRNFDILEQVEICNEDSNNDKNKEYKIIKQDEKKIYFNTMKKVENILKLLDTIKISLLSGILLWTPIFSEILLKVFTLLYIPQWILSITYLGAIVFGILRNILNLKMIKLQEIDTIIIKTNSIYPMK